MKKKPVGNFKFNPKRMLFLILCFVILILFHYLLPPEVPKAYGDSFNKIDDPLETWLDTLYTMEDCPFEGIMDNNGEKSYGPYCYQTGTYLGFMKQYNLMPDAEDAELLNNRSDYDTQRLLTKLIITTEPQGYMHWKTTVLKRGLGLPPINKCYML